MSRSRLDQLYAMRPTEAYLAQRLTAQPRQEQVTADLRTGTQATHDQALAVVTSAEETGSTPTTHAE
jgi:hypothetical protein